MLATEGSSGDDDNDVSGAAATVAGGDTDANCAVGGRSFFAFKAYATIILLVASIR